MSAKLQSLGHLCGQRGLAYDAVKAAIARRKIRAAMLLNDVPYFDPEAVAAIEQELRKANRRRNASPMLNRTPMT